MRVLLVGAQGMLGRDIALALAGEDLFTPTSEELDIRDADGLLEEARRIRPEVIVNTAAFHRVDESESRVSFAFEMNAVAARNLAVAARRAGARLVWISTDYVFDGHASAPYEVDAPPHPICVYGAAKYAGEGLIRMTTDDHVIVRTSGLYGLHTRFGQRVNFVDTALRHARAGRKEMSVVADQTCTPTCTKDLAGIVHALIRSGETGTFHATNSGQCSWAEFAEAIYAIAGAQTHVKRISSADYPNQGRRPIYSVLSLSRLLEAGVSRPREWRDALADHLAARLATEEGP
jgi:dTDP-4-dehydrorhamnose reductase